MPMCESVAEAPRHHIVYDIYTTVFAHIIYVSISVPIENL